LFVQELYLQLVVVPLLDVAGGDAGVVFLHQLYECVSSREIILFLNVRNDCIIHL